MGITFTKNIDNKNIKVVPALQTKKHEEAKIKVQKKHVEQLKTLELKRDNINI